MTTAPDLARFLAAALAGPGGEPPGRGVLSPAGVRLALTAAPATEGRWGLGYGLGLTPSGDRLADHEGANRGWRAGLALLPDRRAGIVVLANGDDGSRPIDAVVQQCWPSPHRTRHTQASHRDARHPDRRGPRPRSGGPSDAPTPRKPGKASG